MRSDHRSPPIRAIDESARVNHFSSFTRSHWREANHLGQIAESSRAAAQIISASPLRRTERVEEEGLRTRSVIRLR